MTTRITQVDEQTGRMTTLRVEGSLRLADAELLESTYLVAVVSGQQLDMISGLQD